MISRRTLLGGAAALAAGSLAGCSSKPRSYDGPPVTGIVVQKARRRMVLLSGATALRSFEIELGGDPVGPKCWDGDGKTPEGAYWIDCRNPNSSYHLFLSISYPIPTHVAYARSLSRSPGGDIFMHGPPRGKRRGANWTARCIAANSREMEDLYAIVGEGTPIFLNR